MKIAIVDDDIKVFEALRSCFDELLGNAAQIEYFQSGEAFLDAWKPKCFDLVILDIFMDGLTGMEVAHRMRETDANVKIVFCTTSNEFASESYEVNACYYLHKPFNTERVNAMLNRLDLAKIENMRSVTLPNGSNIRLRSIIFADYAAHCVTLHCKDGDNAVLRTAFSEIEPILCAFPYFISPTKGVIINLYEVKSKSDDTFMMSDGSMIPISRRKAKEILDAYSAFRFEQLRKGGD